jgi:hypothetical protein
VRTKSSSAFFAMMDGIGWFGLHRLTIFVSRRIAADMAFRSMCIDSSTATLMISAPMSSAARSSIPKVG